MKISVVVPTYKRPALLLKCIAALEKQSFLKNDFEVIVVTDGFDYKTKSEVINFNSEHHQFNISCHHLEKKKGPAAARNKGASLAKGELIVFTDDDCLPNFFWIESFWNAYQSQQQKLIAFSGRTIVPHNVQPTDYEKNIAHLQTAEFITANCACSKSAFELIKGFDEDFPIAWREDSEFQFRLIENEIQIIKVESAIVVHPVRVAFWGISIKEQKKSMFNALLRKKHPGLYKEKISNHPVWNYYFMIILFILFIITIITSNFNIAIFSFLYWMVLVLIFTVKRLQGTSKKFNHIMEMFATSIVIPFLSVYWTLYGSIKYKTLLL